MADGGPVKGHETQALALANDERHPAIMARDLAASFQVETHEQYETAGEVLHAIKAKWNAIEAIRKAWTGPLVNVQRSINGAFKGPLEAYAAAEASLKGKMAAFDQRMHAARVEAVTVHPGASAVPFTPEAKGVNVRYRRAFRVVDPEKVPRQFCSPDEAKIKAHLRDGGLEAIPGVEFFDEPIVTVRS